MTSAHSPAAAVSYRVDPWNEVAPHLWVGGHDFDLGRGGQSTTPAMIAAAGFAVVVSLYLRGDALPEPPIQHRYLPIPDDELTAPEEQAVRDLAVEVAALVRAGTPTLVRCSAGLNRSGLVAALALLELGRTPAAAVAAVRAARGEDALFNTSFVDLIHRADAAAGPRS